MARNTIKHTSEVQGTFDESVKPIRYCFKSDGDHYYLVPVELSVEFDTLLEQGLRDEYAAFVEKFSDRRIDGPVEAYSFESPENDQ